MSTRFDQIKNRVFLREFSTRYISKFCHERACSIKMLAQIVIDRLLNGMWGKNMVQFKQNDGNYIISFQLLLVFVSLNLVYDLVSCVVAHFEGNFGY